MERACCTFLGGYAETPEIRAERQRDGIENAKARGVPFGRRKTLTRAQIATLHAQRQQGTPIRALMRDFRISKATVYRYLSQGDGGPEAAAPPAAP